MLTRYPQFCVPSVKGNQTELLKNGGKIFLVWVMAGLGSTEHGCANMRSDGTEGAIEITSQNKCVSEWHMFNGISDSSPHLFPILVAMSTVHAPLPNVLIHVHNVYIVVLLVCPHVLDPSGAVGVSTDGISAADSPVDESGYSRAFVRRVPRAMANRPRSRYKDIVVSWSPVHLLTENYVVKVFML